MESFALRSPAALDESEASAVRDLADTARHHDGVAPLNEHTLLHLTAAAPCHHLVVDEPRRAGDVRAYAFVDLSGATAGAECVVHPASRGRGLGRALVRAALDVAGERPLEVWAHGDLPAAASVARATGLQRVRELRRMRRDLAAALPDLTVPDGTTLRTFRPGADDEAWVALNAEAFVTHPEQGRMTGADLRARQEQPWFDPAGFFVAEREGVMVGFHWTKVDAAEDPPEGEVYVVGVSPRAQGGGLGRALTLVGLHHLRDRGLASVVLYVEADNAPALRVYERLGFEVDGVDVQYRGRPGPAPLS